MRTRRSLLPLLALLTAVCLVAGEAGAQGKSKGRGDHTPPGQAKKTVTTDRAIVVTREVMVSHGYELVRVERRGEARVIYYRRGNMGRGRGKGPLERMVVRPSREIVVFDAAPRPLLADIKVRLGLL